MSGSGAPTGVWPGLPPQLEAGEAPFSLRDAEARLLVRRPNVPEVTIPIEKVELVIGRAVAEVDLALDDELVSRRHARLSVDPRGYFRLEDLGSRNGIGYLGRYVRRLNLMDGDTFSIGRTELTFHARMRRFEVAQQGPQILPRSESVFGEVKVPIPRPDPAEEGLPPERASARSPRDPAGGE